jgi:hypothetical protein
MRGHRLLTAFVALSFIASGTSAWASYDQIQTSHAAQERSGQVLGEKLCATFGKLAALKPPAGNPVTNPARGYDQELHFTLDQLGADLGCRTGGTP